MKVSELIEKLQDIINANGDVEVKVATDETFFRNIAVGMEAAGIDCIITEQPEWFKGMN